MRAMVTVSTMRVGVVGFSGRMGQQVLAHLARPEVSATLGGLLVHRTQPSAALAPLAFVDPVALAGSVDVVLDFSAPAACARVAPACVAAGRPYLVASTGLTAAEEACLDGAAQAIPVLQAANVSLGVNVLCELVELAAAQLAGADVEILEVHHRNKRDAPSGTALALGAAVARGRTHDALQGTQVLARAGRDAVRQPGEVGYGALRGGDVAGEHTVFVLGDGERLELTHRASHPAIFAQGAITACQWLRQQAPGRYTMRDVVRR